MGYNKILYGSTVLIDLTADTVEASKLLSGYTAHDMTGAIITGTCTFDVDSTDATVVVGEMLEGKTAYARGTKLTGTMPNNGSFVAEIKTVNDEISIPTGFHDGGGYAKINGVEAAKLTSANIKAGVEILGVTGTYGGEAIKAQSKTVTPTASEQVVLPDEGNDYLSQVTIAAIPYVETPNAAGGTTVTIG